MSSGGGGNRLGGNLVLASILAVLSYVPFEWVAKGSLIVCALLFVLDPIPPLSRLLSLISLLVILGLTKLYRQHQQVVAEEVQIVDDSTSSSPPSHQETKKQQ